MKHTKYILPALILIFLFLGACKKSSFERSDQNPVPFNKTISVKEAIILLDENKINFPEGFKIEGVVVAVDDGRFFMQDEGGNPGIKIEYPTGDSIKAGQRVSVVVGRKEMQKEQSVYSLDAIKHVTIERDEKPVATNLSVEDIEDNISQYSSTLISLGNVKLSDSAKVAGGVTYTVSDSTGTLKTFIPDEAGYSLPDSAESITGVIEVINDEVYLNTRYQEDVLEVVPPPTLFELMQNNSGLIKEYVDTQTTILANGVKMYQARYINRSDNTINAFTLFSVDLKVEGNSLAVGMKNDGTDLVARTSLVDMAKARDNAIQSEGLQVVGAVNGDQFVTNPVSPQKKYEPFGPVIKEGTELKGSFYAPSRDGFFALLKNGKCLMGHESTYEMDKSSFEEVTGGQIILEDGEVVSTGGTAKVPRSSIGYTEDDVVFIFQGDGKLSHGAADDGWSNGYSNEDMSMFLKSIAVVNAIYLSAGDYSIAAARTHGSQEIHNVSRPSWVGHGDAWMSNSWLIIARK